MADSRLRRFVGGLGFGYVHAIVTVTVGLWLTPYLLRNLGSHDYGLWLLGAQVLVYLALMDLGVVQLVPRDVAIAAGRANGDYSELQTIVGQTARIVVWQVPPVALVGGLIVWFLPADWAPLRWPLAIVIVTFVVAFPLRLFNGVLQGLQDLAFLGRVQLVAWAVGAAATIGGIAAGLGLYSLSAGWVATQLISAIAGWRRLVIAHSEVLPARLPSMAFTAARDQLAKGTWIGVNQVAQVLLGGTDLVVIGKMLGPEAVVPYACTGKLLMMLANQPQMFMQMALPALSELRSSAPREHLFNVSRSVAQVTLLFSGAIVAVVLAINQPFVIWWVGETSFAGIGLTALLLAGMLMRHMNSTLVYTLFCFGYERRLVLTSVAEGLLGLLVMVLLVPVLGLSGAALGSIVSIACISLPLNLRALAHEAGGSPAAFLTPLVPWFAPFAVAVGAVYVAVMLPALKSPPLGPMLTARLQPWLSRVPKFARRLLEPADALAR